MSTVRYFVVIVDVQSLFLFFSLCCSKQNFFSLSSVLNAIFTFCFGLLKILYIISYTKDRLVVWSLQYIVLHTQMKRHKNHYGTKRKPNSNARNEYARAHIRYVYTLKRSEKKANKTRKKKIHSNKKKSQLMYRNEEHLLATHKHLQLACILLFIAFRLCVFLKSKLNRVYSTLSCIPFNIVFKLHRRQRFFSCTNVCLYIFV